tara:strand:- start:166 stop:399 length:234 start_codon:yes stop_codon:yes gene_type:complete
MAKDYTHYFVVNVEDLRALLAMAEEEVRQNGWESTEAWTPEMHTIVMRFNEVANYKGQLNVTRVGGKTMLQIRNGDF